MKICPKCNKEMPDTSTFCDDCGVTLIEKAEEESIEILETISTVPTIPLIETGGEIPETEEKEEEVTTPPKKTQKKRTRRKPKTPPEAETLEEEEKKEEEPTTPETEPPTTVPPTTTAPETEPPTTVPPTTVPPTTVPPTTVPPTTVPPTTVPPTTVPPTTVPPTTVPPTTTAPTTTAPSPTYQQPQAIYNQPTQAPVTTSEPSPVMQPQTPVVTIPQYAYHQPGYQQAPTTSTISKAKISIILGCVSFVLCCMIPTAIVGLVLAILDKEHEKDRKIGITINSIVIIIGLIGLLFFFGWVSSNSGDNSSSKKTFYGEGYTLTYDSNWKVTNLINGEEALKYKSETAYFSPIGQSKLEETVTCDFEERECKSKTYDAFFKYWQENIDESMTLTKDSSFAPLKDDIYYATYNYTLNSTGELKGKYYLIVSIKKNSVLSFLSNADEETLALINPEILTLLNTIKIKEKEDSSSDIDEYLETMSNWNQFSELRSDANGKQKTIYGEYRILADSTSYWVFDNGVFYWYKDEKNKEDNYWYGEMTVKTGKNGLKSVGINEQKINNIIEQSNGTVTAGDVYSITMKPQQIISGGEDKSSQNIPKGTKWKFVWILVDHGEEGIEAQVLNVDTADTSYFVKVKD